MAAARDTQDVLIFETPVTGKGVRVTQDVLVMETPITGHARCTQDVLIYELPVTVPPTGHASGNFIIIGF